MNIWIIVPKLPPALDGIGDYTALLAAGLSQRANIKLLTAAEGVPDAIPGVEIKQLFSKGDRGSYWRILSEVQAGEPDWLVLQYNPFGYGYLGFNPVLPAVMNAVKKRCPAVKIAIMVHEPCVTALTVKFAVMACWQQPQLWWLGKSADIGFFSIESFMRTYGPWFGGSPVYHLPVPSNITRVPTDRAESRRLWGIDDHVLTLGVFGTLHPDFMLDRINLAARHLQEQGIEFKILYMGTKVELMKDAMEDLPLIAGGPYSADEVSRRFPAMDIYLSPHVDGASTRRGTLMAALQHGIASVATSAYNTDQVLKDMQGTGIHLADAADQASFNGCVLDLAIHPLLRKSMGATAQDIYDTQFSWGSAVNSMLDEMSAHSGNGTVCA